MNGILPMGEEKQENTPLKKNEKEASYLSEMESRVRAFEKRLKGKPSVLEMIYQLFPS